MLLKILRDMKYIIRKIFKKKKEEATVGDIIFRIEQRIKFLKEHPEEEQKIEMELIQHKIDAAQKRKYNWLKNESKKYKS